MRNSELNVEDDPVEVDIGEYHDPVSPPTPYISYLQGSSSQPSLSTLASSRKLLRALSPGASPIPSSPDPSPSPSPGYIGTPPVPSHLPSHINALSGHRNRIELSQFNSPSSPALTRVAARNESGKLALGSERQAKLTRSMTLPKSSLSEPKLTLKKTPAIEGLEMEQGMVDKLRRWILCIAVGAPEFRLLRNVLNILCHSQL